MRDVVTRRGDPARWIRQTLKDGARLLDVAVGSVALDQQVRNVRRHVDARGMQPREVPLCEIHPLARYEHVDERFVGDGVGEGSGTALGGCVGGDGFENVDGLVGVFHDAAVRVDECRPMAALKTDVRIRLDALKGRLHCRHINGFDGAVCIDEELRHMSDQTNEESLRSLPCTYAPKDGR